MRFVARDCESLDSFHFWALSFNNLLGHVLGLREATELWLFRCSVMLVLDSYSLLYTSIFLSWLPNSPASVPVRGSLLSVIATVALLVPTPTT